MSPSSAPGVYLTVPSFNFFPDPLPRTLPAPVDEHSFRSPFAIKPSIYNFVLRPEIPATFASLYIITVFILNAYNRKRNHRPWWIARQGYFNRLVVLHNAVLTLYSALTFLAMLRAISVTLPSLTSPTAYAGVADALCKLHGPRGLGDAATFNTTLDFWEVKNTAIRLGYGGDPDSTDVGRLWNEGLAFWGWWFYVSKFYEVLDTLIILAKGKRSATLQTYHHSGAMLCMWAGIRYMSPPIWMFVFVNSFIHALMYMYFTLSALGIKVPSSIKRTLTSMQIAQFLWGASYAAAHLFVKYDIPVATPYRVAAAIQSAASGASSIASAASSTVSEVIESPAAVGEFVALAKKLLLRAVGEEGIAERVTHGVQRASTPQIVPKLEKFQPSFETKWRTDWTTVDCIDTSGEAFAIYLNLLYLAPLTFLFARFFIKAYTGRGRPRRASHAAKQVTDSGRIAHERVEETVEKAGRKVEDKIIEEQAKLQKVDVKDIHEQMRRDLQAMKEGTWGRERRVSDHIQNFERQVKSAAEKAKQESQKLYPRSPLSRSSSRRNLKDESAVEDDSEPRQGSSAREALEAPQGSSESRQRQDANLEASEPTRPGVTAGEIEQIVTSASSERVEEVTYSEVVKEGTTALEGHEESLRTSILSESRESSGLSKDEDTDAMGRSGAIVDLVTETAEAARDDAKDFVGRVKDFADDKEDEAQPAA